MLLSKCFMDNQTTREHFFAPGLGEKDEAINTRKIINDLLRPLSVKERDIVKRRFGLDRPDRETLEKVGRLHGLTRERIRQIENSIINQKLKRLKEKKRELPALRDLITALLGDHGGLMEKEYLFLVLDSLSHSPEGKKEKETKVKRNHFDFLFSKIFSEELEEVKKSLRFKDGYRLRSHDLDHIEELAEELLQEIKEAKRILKIDELLELISKLPSYSKHQEKFRRENCLELDSTLEKIFLCPQEFNVAVNHRSLYSVLQAIKDIEPNKFGYWGSSNSNEISPRTINDKIYLILKNEGRPMHFSDLAHRINEIGFDHKKANPATIHNELILDEKYVLIGRGMYGLKEWGLKKGTVAEVIKDILSSSGKPLSREEIIDEVLKTREVKRSTINLALSKRSEFKKTEDNKYTLA